MPNHFLGVLENIDGQEEMVCLFGDDEVIDFLKTIKDSSYTLKVIQPVPSLWSLHNLKQILNKVEK